MVFRVENLPTGQSPYESKGYDDDGNRPGLEIMDHAQVTKWAQYVYDEFDESVAIFGKRYSLENGRVFITDTLSRNPEATQLDASIPFDIPTDEASNPTNVLFAVQDLAKQHETVAAFLQEHSDTIEYLNLGRD